MSGPAPIYGNFGFIYTGLHQLASSNDLNAKYDNLKKQLDANPLIANDPAYIAKAKELFDQLVASETADNDKKRENFEKALEVIGFLNLDKLTDTNMSGSIAGTLNKIISYSLNKKKFQMLEKALWNRINLLGKFSDKSLGDRLLLICYYKISLKNGRSEFNQKPEWRSIEGKMIQANSPETPVRNVNALLNSPVEAAVNPLERQVGIITLLVSIAATQKQKGNEPDRQLFERTYKNELASCTKSIIDNEINKNPSTPKSQITGLIRLAYVYKKIGEASLKYDQPEGFKLLRRAGYIYQQLLGENGEGFDFNSEGLDSSVIDKLNELKRKQPEEMKNLKEKRPDLLYYYVLIAFNFKMAFSENYQEMTDPQKNIAGKLINILGERPNTGLRPKVVPKQTDNTLPPRKREEYKAIEIAIPENIREIRRILGMAYIRTLKPEDAIRTLKQNLTDIFSESNFDGASALGNITLLTWAYDLKASQTGDLELLKVEAALYRALLDNQPTSGINDPDINTLIRNILAAGNREKLLDSQSLKSSGTSLGLLHLSYARVLKNTENYAGAVVEYNKAYEELKTDTSPAGQHILLVTQAERLALNAKIAIENGRYEDALAAINGFDLKAAEEKNKAYSLIGKPDEIFTVTNTLAWIYSMKADALEKISGEGAGKECYLAAIRLNRSILDDIDSKKITVDMLTLSGMNRTDLEMSIAGCLQAAGVQDAKLLQESLKYYQAVIKEIPANTADQRIIIKRLKANLGMAEVTLKLGQLRQENNQPEAIAMLGKAFADLKALKIDTPERQKIALKFFMALNWALSLMAENRIKSGDNPLPEKIFPEQAALLVIGRVLLKGEDPNIFSAEWKRYAAMTDALFKNPRYTLNFSGIINFLMQNRSQSGASNLLDEKVLAACGTGLWQIRIEYLINLLSADLNNDAMVEYSLVMDLAKKTARFSDKEIVQLAKAHAAVGDKYCHKLNRFKEAREAYDKAAQAIAYLISNQPAIPSSLLKDVTEIDLRVHSGYGRIYAETMETKKAIEEYKKVIGSPVFTNTILASLDINLLKLYVSAQLGLGDIYNYRLENADEAAKYYTAAGSMVEQLSVERSRTFKASLAKSYLGMGDVYRLRRSDYAGSLAPYSAGIKLFENDPPMDKESKITLAQLYASKAMALAYLGKIKEAKECIKKAKTLIETACPVYDPLQNQVRENIDRASIDIHRLNASNRFSIDFRMSYVSDVYNGSDGHSEAHGWFPSLRLALPLSPSTTLSLDWTRGVERTSVFGTNDTPRYKIAPSNLVTAGFTYTVKIGSVTIRANPMAIINTANWDLYKYSWDSYKTNYTDSTTERRNFFASYLALRMGLEATIYHSEKSNSTLTFGTDLYTSILMSGDNSSPGYAASGQYQKEFNSANTNADYGWRRFSLVLTPRLTYGSPFRWNSADTWVFPSVTGGVGLSPNNTEAVTARGLYPYDPNRRYHYRQAYVMGGLNLDMYSGKKSQWNTRIDLNFNAGTHYMLNGNFGFGYSDDDYGVGGYIGGAYYNDPSGVTINRFDGGIRGYF